MPIHHSHDKKGSYYKWGNHGKKYHFTGSDKTSARLAKLKALKQQQAAFANGYTGK